MANAQEVLAQLNNTWTSMLDKFYDSVADEYIQWMAKEYKMDLKALREKAAPLKDKLLSKATESITAVKTTKKPETYLHDSRAHYMLLTDPYAKLHYTHSRHTKSRMDGPTMFNIYCATARLNPQIR